MVYVYVKQSELNKYIGKDLTVDEIKETLMDLGMDIKGQSSDSDPELKVEITAEKLDMISAVGIARAIKYYRGYETKIKKYECFQSICKLIVKKSAKDSRPKTVAAIIRDAPMSQEFLDEIITIQEKIHESFGRGRKKGAIGIYPLEKINFPISYGSEDPKKIIFKPLESKVEMNALEILEKHDTGKKYSHLLKNYKTYPVFRDDSGKVLSMPPIINSHDTGKVEQFHKDLFIECSGYNLQHLDNLLKVLVTTFIEMGAKAESMQVIYEDTNEIYELNLNSTTDEISLEKINKLIGINLTSNEVEKYLNKAMYNLVEINGDNIKVEIPSYRSDVWHDVDIIDDIARAYGYNNINPTFPNIATIGQHLDFSLFRERISETLVKMGFIELYTYMLTSTTTQYKKIGIDEKKQDYIRLIDSADQGINMVRTLILPDNLESLHINRKNKYPQKVFENGFTIQPDEKADTLAKNQANLSISIADTKSNYTQIKAILDTLFKLNEIEFKVKDNELSYLIEGRRAEIIVKGKTIGFIGEIHPQILENFGLLVPVSSLEINLEELYQLLK